MPELPRGGGGGGGISSGPPFNGTALTGSGLTVISSIFQRDIWRVFSRIDYYWRIFYISAWDCLDRTAGCDFWRVLSCCWGCFVLPPRDPQQETSGHHRRRRSIRKVSEQHHVHARSSRITVILFSFIITILLGIFIDLEFGILILRHFFCHIVSLSWLASCKWWGKLEYPAKTTA